MFRKVLLAYDGTAEGRRALRYGADVAICMKSETYLLAICQSYVTQSIPEGVNESPTKKMGSEVSPWPASRRTTRPPW